MTSRSNGESDRRALTAMALEVQAGEKTAANRLWEAARPLLQRVALALGVPPSDVPDLVQDVLLAAHRGLESFAPDKGSLDSWLVAILVRRARNALRAQRRRRRLSERLRILIPRAASRGPFDAVEARLTLARLLTSLTESQREVIALYEIADLSAEEAGNLLGMSAAGVRSIARDARERLSRAALEAGPRVEARR